MVLLLALNLGIGLVHPALCAEPASPTPSGDEAATVSKAPKRKPKGKRARDQKETDGTEAPDRFEADTVNKSQYHLGGKPLEVDPD